MPASSELLGAYVGTRPVISMHKGTTEVWTNGPTVAPSFKGSWYTFGTGTDVITLPANVAGDLLIIGTNQRNSITAANAPLGWLKIADMTGHAHSLRNQLWAKISDGAEPNPTLTGISNGGALVMSQCWENAGLPAEDGALDVYNVSNGTPSGSTEAFSASGTVKPTWVNPAGPFDVALMVASGVNDYTTASFSGNMDDSYSIETTYSNDSSMFFAWRAGEGSLTFSLFSNGLSTSNQAGMIIIPGV